MACEHREDWLIAVVRDPEISRVDDEGLPHPIHHLESLGILEVDEITRFELVEVVERGAVGRAMSCKHHVAFFAGIDRPGPMGDALVDHGQGNTTSDVLIDADGGNPDGTQIHTARL